MPMRILYIVYNAVQMGGVERSVCQIATALSRQKGNQVVVCSLVTFDGSPFFELDENVTLVHGQVNWRTMNFQTLLTAVKRVMLDYPSDIVVTCHARISYAALLNKRSTQSRVVVTEHTPNEMQTRKRLALNLLFYRFPDQFVVLTEESRNFFRKFGIRRCEVIGNAINVLPEDVLHNDAKVIVSTGRLSAVKGYDKLIRAFALVHEKHPDWTLNLVGDGELRGDFGKMIHDMDLEDCVKLPGHKSDVCPELLNASIYVCSSETESFGLSVLEAMNVGLPVVSFDVIGVRALLQNNLGILVPQGDVQALADGMCRYIEDEELRREHGTAVKKRTADFSIETITERWMELFRDVLKGISSYEGE